ncbi:MAG: DUF1501 domain-containing protein [Planctomycetota bacterium]
MTASRDDHPLPHRRRREFLWQMGTGFVGTALAGLLDGDGFFGATARAAMPGDPLPPHRPARAKAVIFLYMYGGPSHVDTFDHKPALTGRDNQTIKIDTFGRGGKKNVGRIVEPRWAFRPRGRCGKLVSDLFPRLGDHVDDMAFVHSMTAESPIHGSAMLQMNTGKILSGSPCLGSWVNYGLGSVNDDLPGFVVMLDPRGGPISGPKNWSSGYMPASYQATVMRSQGDPILDLAPGELLRGGRQRRFLDALGDLNRAHLERSGGDARLASRIESYELAYRMQSSAPEAVDLASETDETRRLYGMDQERTRTFGRQCLLARRLVERGVRFVQIYSGGHHNDSNWDAHDDLVFNHELHAGETDVPIAGLLTDLKRRGLLDETLIVWGGEFGRQPTAEYEKGTGRDHNAYGFTVWLAGGGIRGGVSVGETDELGNRAVTDPYEVKNLHATILGQLGVDPNRLSFFHGGLDQKLVGVEGAEPIRGLTA